MFALEQRRRDLPIDTLRGLACLLLVVYHAVGVVLGDTETLPPTSHALVYLSFSVMFVRMPLFTFLSGAVYAKRPFTRGRWRTFLVGKARRLVVPFIVVGIIHIAVAALYHGDWAAFWPHAILSTLLWHSHALWFIQALILCFVVVVALEWADLLATPQHFAFVFLGVSAGFLLLEYNDLTFFAWTRMFYLLPFFLFGLFLIRFPEFLATRQVRVALWASALGCLGLVQLILLDVVDLPLDKMGWLGLATGATTCGALLASRWQWPPLAFLGQFSFTVYLFHTFGIQLAEETFAFANINLPTLLIIVASIGGILLPLAVDLVARRYDLGRVFLLGLRPREPISASRYLTNLPEGVRLWWR